MLSLALAVLSLVAVSVVHAAPAKRASVCNGHAELCDRSFSNVTFVGSHDSYAVSSNAAVLSANQNVGILDQLNLGVRLLQAQAHLKDDTVELCHTSCILYDGGSLQDWLSIIKGFLDSNTNEVVALVVTNGDNISVKDNWAPAFQASGIVPYAYVPPQGSSPGLNNWPTLGQLIDQNKRLVVFMDYNSDPANVPYILPEFDNIWEDPYDVTDSTFPCKVDRGSTPNMLMINHFLDREVFGIDVPDRSDASTTNSVNSIVANANGCASLNGGRNPTFVLLDFVDVGQAVQAGKVLNGVA